MEEPGELIIMLRTILNHNRTSLENQENTIINLLQEAKDCKDVMMKLESRSSKLSNIQNFDTYKLQLQHKINEYKSSNNMLRSEIESTTKTKSNYENNYLKEEQMWVEEYNMLERKLEELSQKKEKILNDIKNFERDKRKELEDLKKSIEELKAENINLKRNHNAIDGGIKELIGRN